jgi:hypothetical protein
MLTFNNLEIDTRLIGVHKDYGEFIMLQIQSIVAYGPVARQDVEKTTREEPLLCKGAVNTPLQQYSNCWKRNFLLVRAKGL